MTTLLAEISAGQWVLIGVAAAMALAGFGLMAINILAILRPRPAGETGPPRKLIGKPHQITRRAFFGRALGAGFGIAMLQGFGLGSLAFLWPNLGGGFGGEIKVPDTPQGVKDRIRETSQPYYFAPGRFYLVEYEVTGDEAKVYTDAGLVTEGLMALYQRCVHLGCRVPFCQTSQWFECPCHGSKYNRAGEFRAGPAPRGLDRFPITFENDTLVVNTGLVVTGPPRGTDTTKQQPEGAFCVELGGEEEEEGGAH